MKRTIGKLSLELLVGDIAAQEGIDVVVNAANAQLLPGGGVAGAIHRKAGPELAESCADIAPIQPGQAVITEGYRLPNRFVVHCLGPIYGKDDPEDELLSSCYRSALLLADEHGAASIAFPAISAGAFGYPLEEAAEVAIGTIADTEQELSKIRLVRFVLYSAKDLQVFQRVLATIIPD